MTPFHIHCNLAPIIINHLVTFSCYIYTYISSTSKRSIIQHYFMLTQNFTWKIIIVRVSLFLVWYGRWSNRGIGRRRFDKLVILYRDLIYLILNCYQDNEWKPCLCLLLIRWSCNNYYYLWNIIRPWFLYL